MNASTRRKPVPAACSFLALAARHVAVIAGLFAAAACHLFEPAKGPRNPHPQVAVYECHGEDCRPLDLDMDSVFAESEGMGQLMPVAYSRDEGGGPAFPQVTVASADSGCARVVIRLPSTIEFHCWPKRQTLQVCTTLPAGSYKIRYLPERGTFEVAPGESGKAWSRSQTLLEVFTDGRSSTEKLFKQNAVKMTSYVPLKVTGMQHPGVVCLSTVTLVQGKLKKGRPLGREDASELAGLVLAGADEAERAEGEHWLAWTHFARKHRERLRGKKPLSEKEMQKLLEAYRDSTGAPDTPLLTTAQAVSQRDLKAWQRLSTSDKALWNEYLGQYGNTADVTRREDLRITAEVKLGMALRIMPRYMRSGARDALHLLVNDPVFQMATVLGISTYFALWLAPEPFFSKGMAVLTTVGIMSMCGATAGEIVTLARAWLELRDDTAKAKRLAELEAAAAKFGRALGGSGARLLVAVATIVAGKALGGRRASSPSMPPPALPVLATPQGSPAVALQVRVVGSVPELVAVPLAMAAASGGGSGGSGHGTKPGGTTGFKPFTAANFRENLARLTGGIPKGAEAHHVFPQKLISKFREAGINIHDPRYGAWWQSPTHQSRAGEYNKRWELFFFGGKPKAREEIFQFGRDLAREYGFEIYF